MRGSVAEESFAPGLAMPTGGPRPRRRNHSPTNGQEPREATLRHEEEEGDLEAQRMPGLTPQLAATAADGGSTAGSTAAAQAAPQARESEMEVKRITRKRRAELEMEAKRRKADREVEEFLRVDYGIQPATLCAAPQLAATAADGDLISVFQKLIEGARTNGWIYLRRWPSPEEIQKVKERMGPGIRHDWLEQCLEPDQRALAYACLLKAPWVQAPLSTDVSMVQMFHWMIQEISTNGWVYLRRSPSPEEIREKISPDFRQRLEACVDPDGLALCYACLLEENDADLKAEAFPPHSSSIADTLIEQICKEHRTAETDPEEEKDDLEAQTAIQPAPQVAATAADPDLALVATRIENMLMEVVKAINLKLRHAPEGLRAFLAELESPLDRLAELMIARQGEIQQEKFQAMFIEMIGSPAALAALSSPGSPAEKISKLDQMMQRLETEKISDQLASDDACILEAPSSEEPETLMARAGLAVCYKKAEMMRRKRILSTKPIGDFCDMIGETPVHVASIGEICDMMRAVKQDLDTVQQRHGCSFLEACGVYISGGAEGPRLAEELRAATQAMQAVLQNPSPKSAEDTLEERRGHKRKGEAECAPLCQQQLQDSRAKLPKVQAQVASAASSSTTSVTAAATVSATAFQEAYDNAKKWIENRLLKEQFPTACDEEHCKKADEEEIRVLKREDSFARLLKDPVANRLLKEQFPTACDSSEEECQAMQADAPAPPRALQKEWQRMNGLVEELVQLQRRQLKLFEVQREVQSRNWFAVTPREVRRLNQQMLLFAEQAKVLQKIGLKCSLHVLAAEVKK